MFVPSSAHWAPQDQVKSPYLVYSELTASGEPTFDKSLSLFYSQSLRFIFYYYNKEHIRIHTESERVPGLHSVLKWTSWKTIGNSGMDFISHTCKDGLQCKTQITDVLDVKAGQIPVTGQLHGHSLTSCRAKYVTLRMRKRAYLTRLKVVLYLVPK